MMTNATTAQSSPPPVRQGGDGARVIRDKLRKLIEEAMAIRLAGAAG